MAGLIVPKEVFLREYKGCKIFEDLLDEDAPLIIYDRKGRKVYFDSNDEVRALDLIDGIYN